MSDYKRITRRNEDGTTWVKCVCCENVATCDYTKESCCQVLQNRLAELEDMIEQNVLIKLPCKVGDTVYTVEYSHYYNHWFIDEHEIVEIIIDKNNVYLKDWYGVYVWEPFLTKAEAEAKLEELKRGQK